MVANAIKSLNERDGCSLRAIKKYIAANYAVNTEQLSLFIKAYLKTAVAAGELVQTRGKGASGSFRLAAAKSKKAAVPTAPVYGHRGLSPASKLKKSNPPEVQKAKSTQKSAVKYAATPKKLPSKDKHGTQVPTKKPKSHQPSEAQVTKEGKNYKEVKSFIVTLRVKTVLRDNTSYAKE